MFSTCSTSPSASPGNAPSWPSSTWQRPSRWGGCRGGKAMEKSYADPWKTWKNLGNIVNIMEKTMFYKVFFKFESDICQTNRNNNLVGRKKHHESPMLFRPWSHQKHTLEAARNPANTAIAQSLDALKAWQGPVLDSTQIFIPYNVGKIIINH